MEKFKEKLTIRASALACAFTVSALIYFGLRFFSDQLPVIPSFIQGFQTGVFIAIEMFFIVYMAKYMKAKKDDKALRKMYIAETDEHKILIMQKTGSHGILISLLGLTIGTIIAGFFDSTIFFTLLGATVFVLLVEYLLLAYYSKKL